MDAIVIRILAGFCMGVMLFTVYLAADELGDLTRGLIDSGVPAEVVDELLSGPSDTLGQRALDMLHNGTITQGQYDKIYSSLMALPEAKRWALKDAYDRGAAEKAYDAVGAAAHGQPDDASLRDHVRDLSEQGLTREQIAERLRNEGVQAERLRDLGYGPAEGPSRPGHARDLRDAAHRK